jgi:hypothetical protein
MNLIAVECSRPTDAKDDVHDQILPLITAV